ncbi:MAG: transketolase C-terminal domain-containing protein, partial [Microbacterium sp.]
MEAVDRHFREAVLRELPAVDLEAGGAVPDELLHGLFASQLVSRHADLAARALRSRGQGFYTIGSAGHEGNAAVAAALAPTDPALLHYRSGGFYAERARQHGGIDALRDILLGVVAAQDDPISGGRHKVFGRAELNIVPQTSTIASHLPRALGVARSIAHAPLLGADTPWPRDAVVVASLGDASANHSTAVGAINAAAQFAFREIEVPLLLVCEDNGIGISVPTPRGWIQEAWSGRAGLHYERAGGVDPIAGFATIRRAVRTVREERRPVLLHLETVRFMAHAGADVESAYRSAGAIAADLARDPLLLTAAHLVGRGLATPAELLTRYEDTGRRAEEIADEVSGRERLSDPVVIEAPLRRHSPDAIRRSVADMAGRVTGVLPPVDAPLTLAQSINRALQEILHAVPHAVLFGEDVARKGGVYGVTRGLQKTFGAHRVFDTILDEQTILGLALGAGISGMLPIPEIQYLAYLHNAEDQLRGEAASQAFFSDGRYRNPMVVRIAAYGYQKGFGGHFHNDNSIAVLRDIPGIVIASPSSPRDAAAMLRTCAAAAEVDGRVCVFLEPIALYHSRELLPGDGDGFLEAHAAPETWEEEHVPLGRARTIGEGADLTIVTSGNGVVLSRRAAALLDAEGISVRVVDLRWIAPLPVSDVLREAVATGRVLVVDETRRTGGIGEGVVAELVDAGFRGPIGRVAARDT